MSKQITFLLISLLLFTSCFKKGESSNEKKMTQAQLQARENQYLKKLGMKIHMPIENITHDFKTEFGVFYECEIDGDHIRYSPTLTGDKKIKSITVQYITPDYYTNKVKKDITLKEAIKKHCPDSPEQSQYAWIRNTAGGIYGIADISSYISFHLVDANNLNSNVKQVNYLESTCPVFGYMRKSDYIPASEIKALLK